MLNAAALASDPQGLARLRAVLETDPGYAARRVAALARRPFAARPPLDTPKSPIPSASAWC